MSRLILNNGMILTLDDVNTYHDKGSVVIENDKIVQVIKGGEKLNVKPDDVVIDATDKIVMPGLVDLHSHTAIGKGFNDHLPLWEYLDQCWYPLVRAIDPEAAYWAAMNSYAESIKAGCTTVNDMYRQLNSLADAAIDIGIRAVLCNDVALEEHKLDTLEDNLDAYRKNHGRGDGLIEVRVGIEWIPLSSPELLRDARILADELNSGIHVHLNESETEVAYSLEKFGKRPTELAYEMGLLGPDCIAAHCVHLSDDEIRMLAQTGTHVSHNPNSNAKLGNGVARLPEMLAAKINVGLGHDAVECNNSADMFEVMKWASLVHRAHRGDASLMQPLDVLKMATGNGARALGHKTGKVVEGYKADVILVDTQSPIFTPLIRDTPTHMISHLVFAANGNVVNTSIINGEIVMRDRRLTKVNELEVIDKANRAFLRMKDNLVIVNREK